MTTADDVRAQKRERQFHSARDFETSASQIGDVSPFTTDIKEKAQRIIAGNARGDTLKAQVYDADLLMHMLGIHPDDTWDPEMSSTTPLPHPQNNAGRSR